LEIEVMPMNEFDVIIVGSGAAGLYCALHLNHNLKVLIITKTDLRECNSYLAQGGITSVIGACDKASFVNDTLKAGRYENDGDAVKMLADCASDLISELLTLGMTFTAENGQLCFTKEGGHSKKRVVYTNDETGKHLIETLASRVIDRKNITLWEQTSLVDILEDSVMKSCVGVVVERNGEMFNLHCDKTVLACGGIGGLFKKSTNQKTVSGDAIAIAYKHGITMRNLGYIQFHPTTLYEGISSVRSFLISESVRGEGAYLLGIDKKRFIDELLPRDVVTQAILTEQKRNNSQYVYLDISHKDKAYLVTRFPYIHEKCLVAGYDITKESIPVTPSQHYHMGGIQVDLHGKTSMNNLYAIGEVSCSGAHGANRLASNALLEALVYGEKAALDINERINLYSTTAKNCVVYPELRDAEYKATLVKSLLVSENGGISDELCIC